MKLPVFSKEGYIEVLNLALFKGYSFALFREKDDLRPDIKYCLMRHDIDVSLKCALEMAEIECSLGIKSTYFFMLCSPAYNIFSRYAFKVISKIKEMGHEIGLHFDAIHPSVDNDNLIASINSEVEILSKITGEKIESVSFHQPSKTILKGDLLIPGITNTYNKLQMKGWCYTSDSNRVWKEYNALSIFECGKFDKIQILIHPIWWIIEDENVEDAWDSANINNFYIMQDQFLESEQAYGPRREILIKKQNN